MVTPTKTVFVVDDDADLRTSLCALVTSMGGKAQGFASAEEFLAQLPQQARGIVVADVRMPGMSGLELQKELARRKSHLPIIILTAYANTPLTVEAMQAGAVTIIDKPYHDDDLWQAIQSSLEREESAWRAFQHRRGIEARLAGLTPSERDVVDRLVQGKLNKVIAHELDISIRTVEKRRHDVLTKMQVKSVTELATLLADFARCEPGS